MSEFTDVLRAFLVIPRCIGCGERVNGHGDPLCDTCRLRYNTERAVSCNGCGFPAVACRCTLSVNRNTYPVYHAATYDPQRPGVTGSVIFGAKRSYNVDNVKFISDECVSALKLRRVQHTEECIVTWMPRRRAAIARNGHDQARLIAESIASVLSARSCVTMLNKGSRVQKELSSVSRMKNAGASYFSHPSIMENVRGKRVILVDDMYTTGASLKAGIRLLLDAGAAEIIPLTYGKTNRKCRKFGERARKYERKEIFAP